MTQTPFREKHECYKGLQNLAHNIHSLLSISNIQTIEQISLTLSTNFYASSVYPQNEALIHIVYGFNWP